MKMNARFFTLSLILALLLPGQNQAQIFNRILKEAQRDVRRNVENMVVEKATEAIVRAAMRPIEESFDKMLEDAYREDSTRRSTDATYADTSRYRYADYSGFLEAMNRQAELPEQYSFVLSMDMLIEQGKDKNEFTWHFSEEGRQLAMEQTDKNGRKTIIVMDFERDINALYSEDKNGEKSVQAFPSMNKLILGMMQQETDEQDEALTIRKTGKQRSVAGYRCEEYEVRSSEEDITCYVAQDFPVSWEESYGEVLAQYAPENARKEYGKIDGMVLESISRQLDSKEDEIRMTTIKVSEEGRKIDNAEYQQEKPSNN